jgi:membrane protein YdbS with pleckstrin-like domain
MRIGQQKLHPKAIWVFFGCSPLWRLFAVGLLWAFGFLYFRLPSLALVFLLLSLAGFGVTYLWARLNYEAFSYQLTEYGFYKESGVIQKKPVVIPYNKIHKVEIYRGILEKILGLAGLRIQIAGRHGIRKRRGLFGYSYLMVWSSFKRLNPLAEEELPGLSVEVAEQLKTELSVRRATSTESGG